MRDLGISFAFRENPKKESLYVGRSTAVTEDTRQFCCNLNLKL